MRRLISLISLLVAVILITEGDNIMNEPASADQLPLWAQQKSLWELAQESTKRRPILSMETPDNADYSRALVAWERSMARRRRAPI